jgi:hypothetical protein
MQTFKRTIAVSVHGKNAPGASRNGRIAGGVGSSLYREP